MLHTALYNLPGDIKVHVGQLLQAAADPRGPLTGGGAPPTLAPLAPPAHQTDQALAFSEEAGPGGGDVHQLRRRGLGSLLVGAARGLRGGGSVRY